MLNNYLILLAIVWASAAIGSIATKKHEPFSLAFAFSLISGIGYLILRLFLS